MQLMAFDIVQLLGLALVVVGVWLTAPLGVALILTGLIAMAAALFAEQHV